MGDDRLDLFSLADADTRSTPLWKRLRWPIALTPLGVGALVALAATIGSPSWSAAAVVGAFAGVGVAADLLLKRRWARIRYRVANAILGDDSHQLGSDWLPHERAAAKAAVREFKKLGTKSLSWKEAWAEGAMWPIYFLWFAGEGLESLQNASMLGGLAAVFFLVRAARAGYRADVLQPLLARIAQRQLATIDEETRLADPAPTEGAAQPARRPARVRA